MIKIGGIVKGMILNIFIIDVICDISFHLVITLIRLINMKVRIQCIQNIINFQCIIKMLIFRKCIYNRIRDVLLKVVQMIIIDIKY